MVILLVATAATVIGVGAASSANTAVTAVTPSSIDSAAVEWEGGTDFENVLIECVGKDASCATELFDTAIDSCANEKCVQAAVAEYEREASDAIERLEQNLPAIDRELRRTPAWAAATDSFSSCALKGGLPNAESGDPAAVRRALQANFQSRAADAVTVSERPEGFDDASQDSPKGVPKLDPLPERIESPDLDAIEAADAAASVLLVQVDECQVSSGLIELERQMLIEALNGEN